MICAASFPRPFKITRKGFWRTLLAFSAIPIAPSAAAKDSCPAKKAKHSVSSSRSIFPRLPCPRPTFLLSATEPGIQKAWSPSPIAAAASEAFFAPFLIAIAAPTVYAQQAFSKQIGWMPFTMPYTSSPASFVIFSASSKEAIP